MFWKKKSTGRQEGKTVPPATDSEGGAAKASSTISLSIFIVSDDAVLRVLHSAALREAGFIVETVGMSDETLGRLRRSSAKVLLVDLDLRNGQGFTLIQEGRNQTGTRDSFIIALTSDASDRIERKAARAGADLILNKATTKPGDLVERIKRGRLSLKTGASESPTTNMESPAQVLANARRALQALMRSLPGPARAEALQQFAQRMAALAPAAAAAGQSLLAAEATAFSNTLGRFAREPENWTPAANRTSAQAVDLFNLLAGQTAATLDAADEPLPRSAVIVTANRELAETLRTELTEAGFRHRTFEHPDEVLVSIRLQPTDLVAIDVNIPSMNSLLVCAAVREIPDRCRTPFLFVAAPENLVARSHMMLIGRADIVVHPTQPVEVILKALTLVLQSRAERCPRTGAETPSLISAVKPPPIRAPKVPAPAQEIATPESEKRSANASAAALPSYPTAVLGVDEAWTLHSINDEGRLLFDCVGAQPEGRNLREWFPEGLPGSPREVSAPGSDNPEGGKPNSFSVNLRIPGQQALSVRLSINRSREAGRDLWLVLARPEPGMTSTMPTAAAATALQAESEAATAGRKLEQLLTITLDDRESKINHDSKPQEPVTVPVSSSSSPGEATTAVPAKIQHPNTPVPVVSEIDPTTVPAPVVEEVRPPDAAPALPDPTIAKSTRPPDEKVTVKVPAETRTDSESAPEASTLRQIRARATHLEKANATLQERLERSLEAAAQSAAEAQREQSERRRAVQQVASLTARLSKLHDEMRDILANENSTRMLQENLETRCREQAEALAAAQAQLEQHLAQKHGLEERLRASQELADCQRRRITEIEDSHRRTTAGWNDIDERLNATAQANAELSARLREETEARRQHEELLQKLQSNLADATRSSALESHRLRAELQDQVTLRTQFQANIEELRFEAADADETRHDELYRLENRLRQPVTGLMKTLSQLLESELTDIQRSSLEATVGNVSLIQSHLNDLAGLTANRGRTRLANASKLALEPGQRSAVESCSSDLHNSPAKQF